MEHHVAEVLELRTMVVIHVRDLRRSDFHAGGSGEEDELIGLMGTEVAESASVKFGIPEPGGASVFVHAMRRKLECLHDVADCATLHDRTRVRGGSLLEAAVHDCEHAAGLL